MISEEEIRKLAKLSRLTLHDDEVKELANEFGHIVDYVSQLNDVSGLELDENVEANANYMREDGEPHEEGAHTKEILSNAPKSEEGYIVVNKVLDTDK